jgi:hypothetical protein
MDIEDPFNRDRQQSPGRGLHPVRLPTEEPDPPLFVASTQIAHPVPEPAICRVVDLGERGGFVSVEVRSGNDRPPDDDLARLAIGDEPVVRPGRNGFVLDNDQLDPHPLDRSADANAGASVGRVPGFPEDLVGADRADRERFGRPVWCENLDTGSEHPGKGG